jgi:hypothetical protein
MAFISWLGSTGASLWIRDQSPWLWPLAETLHFIGLALVVGVAGVFDLRLLGYLRQIPVAELKRFLPWAVGGLTINAVTGLLFFTANPYQYYVNPMWWAKVTALAIAGSNALMFERLLARRVLALGPDDEMPFAVKMVGGLSLASWFAVLFFGRMLAFFGGTD